MANPKEGLYLEQKMNGDPYSRLPRAHLYLTLRGWRRSLKASTTIPIHHDPWVQEAAGQASKRHQLIMPVVYFVTTAHANAQDRLVILVG